MDYLSEDYSPEVNDLLEFFFRQDILIIYVHQNQYIVQFEN